MAGLLEDLEQIPKLLSMDGDDIDIENYLNENSSDEEDVRCNLNPEEKKLRKAVAFKTRGNLFYTHMNYKQAIRCYKKAIFMVDEIKNQEDKRDLQAKCKSNIAQCNLKRKKHRAALEAALDAIEINPSYYRGYIRASEAFHLLKEEEMTVMALKKGVICSADNNDKVEKELTAALKRNPKIAAYLSKKSNVPDGENYFKKYQFRRADFDCYDTQSSEYSDCEGVDDGGKPMMFRKYQNTAEPNLDMANDCGGKKSGEDQSQADSEQVGTQPRDIGELSGNFTVYKKNNKEDEVPKKKRNKKNAAKRKEAQEKLTQAKTDQSSQINDGNVSSIPDGRNVTSIVNPRGDSELDLLSQAILKETVTTCIEDNLRKQGPLVSSSPLLFENLESDMIKRVIGGRNNIKLFLLSDKENRFLIIDDIVCLPRHRDKAIANLFSTQQQPKDGPKDNQKKNSKVDATKDVPLDEFCRNALNTLRDMKNPGEGTEPAVLEELRKSAEERIALPTFLETVRPQMISLGCQTAESYINQDHTLDPYTLQELNTQLANDLQSAKDRLFKIQNDKKIELKDLIEKNNNLSDELKAKRSELQKLKDEHHKAKRTLSEIESERRKHKETQEILNETLKKNTEQLQKIEEEQVLSFKFNKKVKEMEELNKRKEKEIHNLKKEVGAGKSFCLSTEARLNQEWLDAKVKETAAIVQYLKSLRSKVQYQTHVAALDRGISQLEEYKTALFAAKNEADFKLKSTMSKTNDPSFVPHLGFNIDSIVRPDLSNLFLLLFLTPPSEQHSNNQLPIGPPPTTNGGVSSDSDPSSLGAIGATSLGPIGTGRKTKGAAGPSNPPPLYSSGGDGGAARPRMLTPPGFNAPASLPGFPSLGGPPPRPPSAAVAPGGPTSRLSAALSAKEESLRLGGLMQPGPSEPHRSQFPGMPGLPPHSTINPADAGLARFNQLMAGNRSDLAPGGGGARPASNLGNLAMSASMGGGSSMFSAPLNGGLLPGQPSPAKTAPGRAKNNHGKLLEKIRLQFPQLSTDVAERYIQELRQTSGGSLSGVSIHGILKRISVFVKRDSDFPFSEDDRNCSICLDTMDSMLPLSTLDPCQHQFHRHCIDQWLKMEKSGNTCPMCRNFVSNEDEFPRL